MGTVDNDRAGVLVLRAWVEAADDQGLRVRITRIVPGDPAEPTTSVSATVDDVCATVRAWLEELVDGRDQRHHRSTW